MQLGAAPGTQPGATSVKPFAGAHTEKEPGSFVTEKEIVTKGASEWKVSMSRKARRRSKKQPPAEEPAPLSRLD